jgi:uncharacterized protein YdaU (DUF1376 family)
MNNPPAFQFYAAEYLADEAVALMSLEEEGAYVRLLAFCWREGSIPFDEELLSRLCKGASLEVVRAVKARFRPCLENASRLTHPRLEAERRKQAAWRQKSSEGGKKAQEGRRASAPLEAVEPLRFKEPAKGGSTLQSSSSSSTTSPRLSGAKPGGGSGGKRDLESEAEEIFEAYPRKAGKPAALKAIRRQLASHSPEFLLECTRRYAIARVGQDSNFTPHPATWFSQQRFNDEPSTWSKRGGAGVAGGATDFEEF